MTDPDGGRLPLLDPDDLDEPSRAVYDAIVTGPRTGQPGLTDPHGRLLGPFNAMLYSPTTGMALQQLGAALRYHTTLTDRERELAILTVAAHHRSDYEWSIHAPAAQRAGLDPTPIPSGRLPGLATDRERAVHTACRQLLITADLDDAAYDEALATLGPTTLVELITLVGYYTTLALHLRTFRIPAPPGADTPWQR